MVRQYRILEPFYGGPGGADAVDAVAFTDGVSYRPRHVEPPEFERVCGALGKAAHVISRTFTQDGHPVDSLVSRLIARYSLSLVPPRAVVLLDVVGFSLRTPLEQVAMLNSISFSVNSAHRQLLSSDVDINFASTTTGDRLEP
ncbi:MAG: hypothetical protein ACK52I_22755 [Pseudomonadota bacterium]